MTHVDAVQIAKELHYIFLVLCFMAGVILSGSFR